VDKYDGPTNIIFELDKQELEDFCAELESAEESINALLSQGVEAEEEEQQ
jgi:hypothetical protein